MNNLYNNVFEDYYFLSVPQIAWSDPILLLSLTGVLYSRSGFLKLYLADITIEHVHLSRSSNTQNVLATAYIHNLNKDEKKKLQALGAPSQAYAYLAQQFSQLCITYGDELLLYNGET